ncbi:unnamed protein product [Bemisia tabaci]|uniref:Uncharacterized protein n=1 Tax=Bemisia tabaci TaxID=7038 RepID=A0A9N9ZWV0_BEMTA|nr:unnamed protein product [Bemisia tabaci]
MMSTRAKFEFLRTYLLNDRQWQLSQSEASPQPLKTLGKGMQIESIYDPFSLSKKGFGDIFDVRCQKIKQGIEDWQKLRGHSKLILESFTLYFGAAYASVMITNAIMAYAAVYALRHSESAGKKISETTMYFAYVMAGSGHLLLTCFNATLFRDTYDGLKFSLSENDWCEKSIEHKKLLLNFRSAMNSSLKMKAFSVISMNLECFTQVSIFPG